MAGFHTESIFGKAGLNGSDLGSPGQPAQPPLCPRCGLGRVWKDGKRHFSGESANSSGSKANLVAEPSPHNSHRENDQSRRYGERSREPVQRYLCRNCNHRFSDPNQNTKDKNKVLHNSSRQVCEEEGIMAALESQRVGQREATTPTTPDQARIKGKLVEFMFWLQKQGYDKVTTKKRFFKLRRLVNLGGNLYDPESIKELLGKQKDWKDSYKREMVYTYENFLSLEGLTWTRPMYRKADRVAPFIPTEAELDMMIASCGPKTGTFLQGLKDTGCDPGELAAIAWADIDRERKFVNIRHPVKGHNPRVLKVSSEFLSRLESLPKTSERIFSLVTMDSLYYRQRKSIARKLANPRLRQIALTTFRDWKLTMTAKRYRDPFKVMAIAGHKSMDTIMFYVNLAEVLYGKSEYDEYTVRVANNVGEAAALVEAGFEYVTGEYGDGGKIFKKLKTDNAEEYGSTPQKPCKRAGSSVELSGRGESPASPPFFVSERLVATRHCADRRFLYLVFEDSSGHLRPQRVSKKEAFG